VEHTITAVEHTVTAVEHTITAVEHTITAVEHTVTAMEHTITAVEHTITLIIQCHNRRIFQAMRFEKYDKLFEEPILNRGRKSCSVYAHEG
jgi:hypothetical protein